MNIDFYSLDVETANFSNDSICQIGIAGFSNGNIVSEYVTLINPQEHFEHYNVKIHGITEKDVKNAPKFYEIYENLISTLQNHIVVCHTYFDKFSLNKACGKYRLDRLPCFWLDSSRVARRVWRQFAHKGYNLLNVCNFLGYTFKHHDALEDAKAAGHIIISACREEGIRPKDLLGSVMHTPQR
jgi:DNA polymerase-3 subunit epsilon